MRSAVLALALIACGPVYPPPPPPTSQPVSAQQPGDPPARMDEDRAIATPPVSTPPTSGPVPLVSSGTPPASTRTQAEIAARKDWEGQDDYRRGEYADASMKFREAVARVPEARYFYNLCASLYMEGKFTEALTSCNAVQHNNPSSDLVAKANGLTAQIQNEARAQGLTISPP